MLVDVVGLGGFRPGDEPFRARVRTELGGEQAGERADFHLNQSIGTREVPFRFAFQHFADRLVPDGGRAGQAGHFLHGLVVAVADPHADDDIGGVADRPVVVEVGGGAGLDRRGTVNLQGGVPSEAEGAGVVVGQDIAQ